MDVSKVLPWSLCVVLVGICWQQQMKHEEYKSKVSHKIATLEVQKLNLVKKSLGMKRTVLNPSVEMVSSQQVSGKTQKNQVEEIADMLSLADPPVITEIYDNRKNEIIS